MRLLVLAVFGVLSLAPTTETMAQPSGCRSLAGQNLCDLPDNGPPPDTGPPTTTFNGPPAIGQGPRAGGQISSIEKDVEWCINGSANKRLDQQPMRGYCPQALTGQLVGMWAGNQYAYLIASRTQKQWSRLAIPLACQQDPQALAAAVGLLALCQCHDAERAERMLQYPNTVLRRLRLFDGGC